MLTLIKKDNKEGPKFQNWSEEVFETSVITDLKDEEIVGRFYETKLQKIVQKKFREKK